mmetsp:Transcript_10647/g.13816  ORF Transcript_10647/g.13816 Transcript_10647/m.13816 type:complete len:113 (+) Transcript_10647:61-399(+)|eukprot:CAMPEP_0117760442 /NCGR_PEP_ID=MMETSP0947-20121206/16632_1 /TAXON_ID=44440 /ORGANISM="Chattonella subsalsa, Strain CCMP2191" /LENGTH=112 /DNA_ID=CAMNT_0005581133 /DNA_START=24 /DNA_END=362 /DNA_ORIENTATION=-
MSGFLVRVMNYLANEIMVKKLAENKQFQQFALRTAQKVEKAKGAAGDIFDDTVDNLAKGGQTKKFQGLRDLNKKDNDPIKAASASSEFSKMARLFEEVKKEISKDINQMGKK